MRGCLAGHRSYQGHWMVDVGPKDAPTLAVQVMLNRVHNFGALRAALERLLPGSEYGDDAPDLGTMFRPSASSHDPRYPAGRTRLLLLGGLVGVGALAGLVVLGTMALQSHQREAQRLATEARLARLMSAAEAVEVPAGQAFSCDKSVDEQYDLVFATRGPKGVERPGLLDRDEAFSLYGSSATVVGSFSNAPYLVLGEVRGISGPAKGLRVVTIAMRVVDSSTNEVVCSGELRGQFAEESEWSATSAMSEVLVQSMCKSARCTAGSRTVLVNPAAAEVPSEELASAPPPAARAKKAAPAANTNTAAIREVVQRHSAEVRYCYEKELQKNPLLAGRVLVAWTIDRSGGVSAAKVNESSLGNVNVERCIVQRVLRWKFPEVKGASVSVAFPWVFKAG